MGVGAVWQPKICDNAAALQNPAAGSALFGVDLIGGAFVKTGGAAAPATDGTIAYVAISAEQLQDLVGAFFNDSSSIDVTYDDVGNALTANSVLKVQTQLSTTNKVYGPSDVDKWWSRVNANVAMGDTMPAITAALDGHWLAVANDDTAAAITFTASAGQFFVNAAGAAGATTFVQSYAKRTMFVAVWNGGVNPYWRIWVNNNNVPTQKSGSSAVPGNLIAYASDSTTTGNRMADSGFAASSFQPADSDLTAIALLATTAFGRAFLTLADAAAGRTYLALGTVATLNTGTGAGDIPTITIGDARYQASDADLTAIAALATTSFGRSLLTLANTAALTTNIDLATTALKGALSPTQFLELMSLNGDIVAGGRKTVFRPGDYAVGNTYDPTGVANSTSSFQAAWNAFVAFNDRATFEMPSGVFKVDAGVFAGAGSAPGAIIGANRGTCVLIPNSGAADFINLNASVDGFEIGNFAIYNTSGAPFTTNDGIDVNGADDVAIHDMLFVDLFRDINVNGAGLGSLKISMQRLVHSQSNGNANSVGILVNNGTGGDTYIGPDIVMSNTGATRRRACVEIVASGHYEITQANLTGSAQGILIDPGAGQIVAFGFHQQVLCDSCSVNGMNLNATTATSTIKNIKSSNSWYSGTITGGFAGVITQGVAGGIINGISFDGDRFLNNQTHGFQHGFGTDFRWVSCDMKGNSAASSGANNGLNVAANVSNWSVIGGKFGGSDTVSTATTQGIGINVAAGTSTNWLITDVDCSGNTVGPLLVTGVTGAGVIRDVIGMPQAPVPTFPVSLVAGAATENYVTAAFPIPLGSLQVGSRYRCTIEVSNSATINTLTIRGKAGTAGTIADGNTATLALTAGTAAAGSGIIIVEFLVKALGNGTTAIRGFIECRNTTTNIGTTGLTANPVQSALGTLTTLNSTAAMFIGVTLATSVTNIVTVQATAWEVVGTRG